jgi:hypothetical protein
MNMTDCDPWEEFYDQYADVDYDEMTITWTLTQQHWYDYLQWRAQESYYGFAGTTMDTNVYLPEAYDF